MTWIVGVSSSFGYSFLVSDIRVTFKDISGEKKYFDCLQKIYPVGRFVLGGFAGSVEIGFRLLKTLNYEFSKAPKDTAWDIDVISNTWWPRIARRIYDNFIKSEKNLGSKIILASTHPTKNNGDTSWPITNMSIFSSPDFTQEKSKNMEVVSIGIGSSMQIYKNALKELCEDGKLLELETLGWGMTPSILAKEISEIVEKSPNPSVSKLFQVGIVTRGKYSITNNEYSTYYHDGRKDEITFPKIAVGYSEFKNFCKVIDTNSEEALC